MNAHTPVPAVEKAFRIDWAIELNAGSPHEAACRASEIENQLHTATIYSVTDKQTGEITVHDLALDGAKGTNFPARRPEDTGFVARSLRLGRTYRTREGHPAEVVEFDREGEFPLAVRFQRGGIWHSGIRTKAGLHPQGNGQPHPLDIVEVNPPIVKWVRMYDRKLNEAGKQVVAGKEFAAERALSWYIFDTEAEARASLQGVRAVFPVEYREGEGIS